MNIINCTADTISIIKQLAYQIWPHAYGKILEVNQITYMLKLFYNEEALLKQFESGQKFILIEQDDTYLGFAAYEFNCKSTNKTKLHKIYVLPETQGKGVGKQLLDYVENQAKYKNEKAVFLNVNKYNTAQKFYQNLGYKIVDEEVIEIGNGYVMDDYIMEKPLI